jgi:hypothetical protein
MEANPKLLDGVGGYGQPDERLLRLAHDVGDVEAVVSEVVVIETAPGKPDAALVAATGVNGAGTGPKPVSP